MVPIRRQMQVAQVLIEVPSTSEDCRGVFYICLWPLSCFYMSYSILLQLLVAAITCYCKVV